MRASKVTDGAEALLYDAFIREARSGSYAQDRAWAALVGAGPAIASRAFLFERRGEPVGAALVLQPRALGVPLPTAIVPRGPVTRSLDDLEDVLHALRRACLALGIVRLSVMPYWMGADALRAERILEGAGFRSIQTFASAHARTVRLSLEGEHLFAGAEHRAFRTELRRAARAGASARRGSARDIETFAKLHHRLMMGQGLLTKPASWFDAVARLLDDPKERAALFVCEDQRDIVGIVLVARHEALATYVAGATSNKPCAFGKTAPAMREAITWARAVGCTAFDLGGIPLHGDPDPKRHRIARFKRTIAETPLTLVREHERWF